MASLSMVITRGVKQKLARYGANLPVDKRTRAYAKILKDNNWTEGQYASYLKETAQSLKKKENKKIKAIIKEVANAKIKKEVQKKVAERNMPPVRYVGSTAVQFKITEDRDVPNEPNNEARTSFDTLTNREFLKKVGSTTFFTEWHDIPFDNEVKNERETNSVVEKQVDKLQNKIFSRPYVIDVEILRQNKSIHKYTNIPMSEIRMRKSGSLNIDGYEPQPWDKKTDKCVYDYIIHTYGNIRGFKKVCNYNTISEVFGDDECYTRGVNSWNIRAWCVEYNVPMSAFDDNERRFLSYTPPKRNQIAPSMLFRVSDGHFYPIPSDKRKSLITIATQIDAKSDIMYKHIKEEKNKSVPITDVVILENTNPMHEVGKYMLETNTKPTSIVVNDGNLKSFKIKGITYTINQFIPLTKELCVNMNIDYVGQSMCSILSSIIKDTIGELKVSHHNPQVFDSLVLAKKQRVHTGLICDNYKDLLNNKNTIARDINKHYTSIMYKPSEKWMRFGFNDKWEKYDGVLKLGLYYVETDDTTLFRKSDVYSSSMIKKAQTENIDINIKYQLLPSYSEKKNTFTSIIDKIIEHSKGNKDIYKLMINMMSGMLAKTKCTTGKYHINNDINQIFAFIREYPDMRPIITQIPNTEHYLYGAERELVMTENNLGMYIQLIDQSNIKLYDMVKKMGGTLLARKVDCAVVHYDKDVPTFEDSDIWGGSRQCSIPKFTNTQKFENKNYKIKDIEWVDHNINDSDDWEKIKNVLVNKGGLLLQADAGCGKTYVAKMIANTLENVKKIAPTNKAALNLKGSTIHKFLNMDIDGNVSTAKLNYIKHKVNYIIVDEISMITKELWRRLAFVKRATGVIFLLLGDDKQLPPVEDEAIDDYFHHSAVKYLCNNNRNILTVMKRFNIELKEILNDVENIDINRFSMKDVFATPINIAYTHKTRKAVNKKWNDKLKPNNSLYIPVTEDDKKYGQDMYLYSGCPMIARMNDNKNGMYMNNETFEVVNYDDDVVYLITERPNDVGELEVHSLEVAIDSIQKLFYLNYCTTIHKMQGVTIHDAFTIWDWNHPCMSKKAKYTALSRGTCPENISIVGKYEEEDNNCNNDNKIREKLNAYLQTDKEKGFDNDLTVEKVKTLIQKQNGVCNICNCDLKMEYSPKDRQQFSVDRIDSRQGHLCSNIQVLCWGCNSAKGARF